ncbi:hypothetical protein [Streptomyces sp. HB132]|uniref:hypothetical protein n=1 Tax=Streptomyces sp. HB132 TaxID=767388 RepID=UPI001E0F4576|nr:hypothetical protein [Streptomyces sp. HB132]MBM7439764.1 hypothetical protein [Streptomyces sp. HB132]
MSPDIAVMAMSGCVGLCRGCRTAASDTTPTAPAGPTAERDVHALVGQFRELTRLP